jgi:hypothetical protein
MRAIAKPALVALGLSAATAFGIGSVVAQSATTPPTASPQAPTPQIPTGPAAQQMALTPGMVDQFIAAKKDVDAVLDKLPDGTDQPDPATTAKLDAVARKYNFADYKQYDMTENNIGIVMAGVDPQTKQYVGPEAVIKKQIADIEADKQISAKDKKDTVDQLNAALSTVPKLQFPDNVAAVTKNFDKLNEAMPVD